MRIAVFLVPLSLVACGGGSGGGPTEAPVRINSTGIVNPAITIPTGGRVHYFNNDSAAHQVVSTDCADLDTPVLQAGQDSLRPVMTGPLSCTYHDANNPNNPAFSGTVTVNAPSAGGGGGGGGSGY